MKSLVLFLVIFVFAEASIKNCKKDSKISAALCNTVHDKCLSKVFSEAGLLSKKCSKTKLMKVTMTKKYKKLNETFCGSDGKQYLSVAEAINAAQCNSVDILHKGACGQCSEDNLCNKSMRKPKTVKINSTMVYSDCCQFKVSVCKAFSEKNQVILFKSKQNKAGKKGSKKATR